MSLLQHLPLGPCPIIRAEESSREAFVQDLGGRIARFVPGTSAMGFFLMDKWRVGSLPGSFSMIVKARRLLFVMAAIARFKRLQCLGVRVGKVASCEGGSSKSTSVAAFFQ